MRQRAMIAMALACDPAIVIGDEPTTALDVMVQAQILQLLEQLRQDLGLSLILITHDLSVIAETCDKAMVMYAGRVAEEGPVRRVFTAPRHPYTRKLLSAFPNIHADRRTLDVIPGSPPDLRTPPPGCRFAARCPEVMDVCRQVVPVEVRFPDGVRVACHLYPPGGEAVEVAPPAAGAPRGPVRGCPGPSRTPRQPTPRRRRGRRVTEPLDGHDHGVVPHAHDAGDEAAAAEAAARHAAAHDPALADVRHTRPTSTPPATSSPRCRPTRRCSTGSRAWRSTSRSGAASRAP